MSRRRWSLTATAVALIVSLAACTSISGDDEDEIIVVGSVETQTALTPVDADEPGELILDHVFSGLVVIDEAGVVHNEVAEEITSDDSQVWEITISEGWTFTDGTAVTAQSFADAWSAAAIQSSDRLVQEVFGDIRGVSAWRAGDADEFRGIEVVDDTTLIVDLARPDAQFPYRLAHRLFYPLPEAFYDSPWEAGEVPIGNGPYLIGDEDWNASRSLLLSPNPDYDGMRTPLNDGVEIVFYDSVDDALSAVNSGNVHVVLGLTALEEGDAETMSAAGPNLQTLVIPEWVDHFGGNEGILRRQALSLAIDRDAVVDEVFSGFHVPALDFTSPLLADYRSDLDGSINLIHDAERAVDVWSDADDISEWDGTLTLTYNADGGHEAWLTVVAGQIEDVLSINVELLELETFNDLADAVVDREIDGAYRLGWQPDFATAWDYLNARFATDGSYNGSDYSSETVDDLLSDLRRETDAEARANIVAQIQEELLNDLPAIPLWNLGFSAAIGSNVTGVEPTWKGTIDFTRVADLTPR